MPHVFGPSVTAFYRVSQKVSDVIRGALKMREWKMQEQTAGVENTGATKYGKPSEEENTLKYETKIQLPCRPSSANQSSAS